jgi:hypothetical protein
MADIKAKAADYLAARKGINRGSARQNHARGRLSRTVVTHQHPIDPSTTHEPRDERGVGDVQKKIEPPEAMNCAKGPTPDGLAPSIFRRAPSAPVHTSIAVSHTSRQPFGRNRLPVKQITAAAVCIDAQEAD